MDGDVPDVPSSMPPGGPSAAIRRGSKSFAMASWLMDPTVRGLVWDLYAWCRHCDDRIDGQDLGRTQSAVPDPARELDALRMRTARAYDGAPDPDSPFAALARVIDATQLPHALAADHLNGYAMDVEGRRFHTLDDTVDYSYHVAGVVGLMMAWVMGVRDAETLYRASDLGIAFQLSNIARDVGDDLRAGRIYLPDTWLDEAHVSLAKETAVPPDAAPHMAWLVARLVAEAERYYESAYYGIGALPRRSAWAVATARLIYRRIGLRTVARGPLALRSRTVVSMPYKIASVVAGGVQSVYLTGRMHGGSAVRNNLYTPAVVGLLV